MTRMTGTDLELVSWSRRVVALWQVYEHSLPTCLSLLYYSIILLFCCGPLLLFGSWSINTIILYYIIIYSYSLSGEYRRLVLLGSVEDIYAGDPIFPLVVTTVNHKKTTYIPLPPLVVRNGPQLSPFFSRFVERGGGGGVYSYDMPWVGRSAHVPQKYKATSTVPTGS